MASLRLLERLLGQRADSDPWFPLDYAAALTDMQAALGVATVSAAIAALRRVIEEAPSLQLSMDGSHVRTASLPITSNAIGKRRAPTKQDDGGPPSRRMRRGSAGDAATPSNGTFGTSSSDSDDAVARSDAAAFDLGVAMLEAGEANGTAHADSDFLRGALAEDAEAVARGAASGAAIRGAIESAGPRALRRRAPVASSDSSAQVGSRSAGGAHDDRDGAVDSDVDGDDDIDSGVLALPEAVASELYSAADGPPGADGSSSRARTLFLGNIAPATTAALLMELASQCGPVRILRYFPAAASGTVAAATATAGAGDAVAAGASPPHAMSRESSNDAAGAGVSCDVAAGASGAAASSGAGAGAGAGTGTSTGPGQSGYAFVEFEHEVSLHYASRVLSGVPLFGQPLRAQPPRLGFVSEGGSGTAGAGGARAQLFVRPLPDGVDEWDLADIGAIALDAVVGTRVPTWPDGRPRGFGFIEYPAARVQEVVSVALPALRSSVYLFGRQLTFNLSEQSVQPSAAGSAGESRAAADSGPIMLGDATPSAAGAGTAAGAAEGSASSHAGGESAGGESAGGESAGGTVSQQQQQQQRQLPVDAAMLHGLRVEALTALCRSIEARIRGWPAPAQAQAQAGPASSPTNVASAGFGSRTASSAGLLSPPQHAPAAAMPTDSSGSAGAAAGGAGAGEERRSRWDREPRRDSRSGYYDRDREPSRERSVDNARGPSYVSGFNSSQGSAHAGGYGYGSSSAAAVVHNSAPPIPSPAAYYHGYPSSDAALLPPPVVSESSGGSSWAAGPVSAALGLARSSQPAVPAQWLQSSPPAFAQAPAGYILVPTSAPGLVLVPQSSGHHQPEAAQNRLYGMPRMDI